MTTNSKNQFRPTLEKLEDRLAPAFVTVQQVQLAKQVVVDYSPVLIGPVNNASGPTVSPSPLLTAQQPLAQSTQLSVIGTPSRSTQNGTQVILPVGALAGPGTPTSTVAAINTPVPATKGPAYTGSNFYVTENGTRVRFIAKIVSGNFNRSEISAKAKTTAQNYTAKSHIWDDRWYHRTLKDSGTEYLLIIAHNMDTGARGWMAVKNSPQKWKVMDYTGKESIPGNAVQVKKTFTMGGERVDLDVYNPRNEFGYTSNHIYYSFGY